MCIKPLPALEPNPLLKIVLPATITKGTINHGRINLYRASHCVISLPKLCCKAFLEHRQKYGMTQVELSRIVGLSQPVIHSYEQLIFAANKVQSYVESGELDTSTAYEISTIKDKKKQIRQVIAKPSKYFLRQQKNNSPAKLKGSLQN